MGAGPGVHRGGVGGEHVDEQNCQAAIVSHRANWRGVTRLEKAKQFLFDRQESRLAEENNAGNRRQLAA